MKNTENYNLPLFESGDKFNKETINETNTKIDLAIGELQETINTGGTTILTTQEVIQARKGKENLKTIIDEIESKSNNNAEQLDNIERKINYCYLEDFGGGVDKDDNTSALLQAQEHIYDNKSTLILLGFYKIKNRVHLYRNGMAIQGVNGDSCGFVFSKNAGFDIKPREGSFKIHQFQMLNLRLKGVSESLKCDNLLTLDHTEEFTFENIYTQYSDNPIIIKNSHMLNLRVTLLISENGIQIENCGFITIKKSNIWDCKNSIVLGGWNSNIVIENTTFEYFNNLIYSKNLSPTNYNNIKILNCHVLDAREDVNKRVYNQDVETNTNKHSLNLLFSNTTFILANIKYLFTVNSNKTAYDTIYKFGLDDCVFETPNISKVFNNVMAIQKNVKLKINNCNLTNTQMVTDDTVMLSGNNDYFGYNVLVNGYCNDIEGNGVIGYDYEKKRYYQQKTFSDTREYFLVAKSGVSSQRPTNNIVGDTFFDYTLGKLVVWNSSVWVDSNGIIV